MEKIEALAKYLGCEVEDIMQGYDDDHFEYGNEEYLVCDDYDTAYDLAVEYTEDLLDDIGFTSINGWEQFVDADWFEDAFREMEEVYVNDIESESDSTYENRLIAELVDEGILSDDDFEYSEDDEDQEYPILKDDIDIEDCKEQYVDNILNGINDFVEEYKWQFGDRDFEQVCIDNNLVDLREIAKYCIDSDGPESELAGYDGAEIELEDGYYAYRQN